MKHSMVIYGSLCLLALVGGILSFSLDSYGLLVFTLWAASALVGIGLNILMGLSGQISFGHIAFYAIGAYASALLMMAGVPFGLSMIFATLVCAFIGGLLALPALRAEGPYLAMITIAFAFIVHHGLMEWRSLTGGANGLMGIPMPNFGNLDLGVALALTTLGCLILGLLFYFLLSNSGWGRAMRAVKASDVAARSLGFNPVTAKMLAFSLSAALTGLAGAVIPPLLLFVSPSTFPFSQSILFVLAVIVGGTGTLFGPLIGALIIVLFPEFLAPLAEYRLLLFAALLLIVLWIAPKGLLGSVERLWSKPEKQFPPKSVNRHLLSTFYDQAHNNISGLHVQDIGIRFGGVQAAKDVSFTAPFGSITSIIGPNGAGKTTVLNMISGFYVSDSGSIKLDDELVGKKAFDIAKSGIARTYQTTLLFDEMSVLENVLTAFQKGNLGSPIANEDEKHIQLAMNLLAFVGYESSIHLPASSLPHVDRRLVEIARALAMRPWVLLLDEPAAGLSREDTNKLEKLLSTIASFGIAVILVEHDMQLVMSVSEQVLVLDGGYPIAWGSPDQVRANDKVITAYLGATDYQAPPRPEPWVGKKLATLVAKDLSVDYGAAPVVEKVNFVVYPGELVAILGANGAGKSSIMSALSGLHRPISGSILLNDQEINIEIASDIAKRGMALVPEGRQLFGELTVLENLLIGAYSRPTNEINEEEEIEYILQCFPRLRERLNSPAALISGGEQQMVAVGRGLMAKPSILMLDEPSLGLAPAMIAELFDALARLRDEGVTILLVDQMAHLALQVADRAYVLETGKVVKEGLAENLRANSDIEAAYLGQKTA